VGINILTAQGPIPTTTGGWGLRNPRPEEPDPTQYLFIASHKGVGWAKFWRQ